MAVEKARLTPEEVMAMARHAALLASVMRKIVINAHQVTHLTNYQETVHRVAFTTDPVDVSQEEWDALNALPGMGYESNPEPEPDEEEV
jgi:hypothetical protein